MSLISHFCLNWRRNTIFWHSNETWGHWQNSIKVWIYFLDIRNLISTMFCQKIVISKLTISSCWANSEKQGFWSSNQFKAAGRVIEKMAFTFLRHLFKPERLYHVIFFHEKSHNDFENFEESIDSSNFVDTVWKSAFVAFMYSGGRATIVPR